MPRRKYAKVFCSLVLAVGFVLTAPAPAAADTGNATPDSAGAAVVPLGPFVMDSGAYVSVGGAWTNAARADQLENSASLAPADILSKIDQLPIAEWNYKTEGETTKHVGPTAEGFYAAFGLGGQAGTQSISTVDSSGIALLGIQALSKRIDSLEKGESPAKSPDASSDASPSTDTTARSSAETPASSTPVVADGSGLLDTIGYTAGQIVDGVVHFGQVVMDKITANLGVFNRIETDDIQVAQRICLGSTCLTESELQSLLNVGSLTTGTTSAGATQATSTPEPTDDTASSTRAISDSEACGASASATSAPSLTSESTSTPATACASASSTSAL